MGAIARLGERLFCKQGRRFDLDWFHHFNRGRKMSFDDKSTRTAMWRFNKVTGVWVHERACINKRSAEEWLEIFQRDQPDEIFRISVFKPKLAPEPANPRVRL